MRNVTSVLQKIVYRTEDRSEKSLARVQKERPRIVGIKAFDSLLSVNISCNETISSACYIRILGKKADKFAQVLWTNLNMCLVGHRQTKFKQREVSSIVLVCTIGFTVSYFVGKFYSICEICWFVLFLVLKGMWTI